MADGRYTRIKSRFWDDEKVARWDDSARLLALYLLTSPHNNSLGCYVLKRLYICADLNWSPERLTKPFQRLIDEGFILYDEATSMIMLPNFLKHNPLENGNQVQGAIKALDELPKSPIFLELKQLLEQLDKHFLKPLLERLDERYGNPVTVTVTETETVNNMCMHPGDAAPEIEPETEADVDLGKEPTAEVEYPSEFEEFWSQYPRKKEKAAAFRCWKTRRKEGHLPRDMLAAAQGYRAECIKLGTQEQFVKLGKTFLGPARPFEEYLSQKEDKQDEYYSGWG